MTRAREPRSTYRLQIRSSFTLTDAAELVDYLDELGVDWVYVSPLLRSRSDSDHGYDVVSHEVVDESRGGAAGLQALADAAHARGMGVLVDLVPNHVGVAVPAENAWWWSLLERGRSSPHADAFDVDWEAGGGRVRIPVLGGPIEEAAASGDLRVEEGELRYFDHRFPLAPGSDTVGPSSRRFAPRSGTDASDPERAQRDEGPSVCDASDRERAQRDEGPSVCDASDPERAQRDEGRLNDVLAVHARQHYELVHWTRADADLNYRRFFAVNELAGIRVEDPAVFDASHREILRWVHDGLADGLRVDHPDGLAAPGAYLERLADETDGAYVLVEKILEHGEALPPHWRTDGTTGYDALADIDRVLVDPAGEAPLEALDARLRAETDVAGFADWADLVHTTKRGIADGILRSEVNRLARMVLAERPSSRRFAPRSGSNAPDPERPSSRRFAPRSGTEAPDPERAQRDEGPLPHDLFADALAELLTCFPVYRSYLPAGREHLEAAAASARRHRPDLEDVIDALLPLLGDPASPVAVRFQQTSGMVMAKGVEDTAFYRYTRLTSLTEVGGDPSEFAIGVDEFHRRQQARQATWPHTMTTLSTHDTKRGEDVRARIDVLAEVPDAWAAELDALRGLAGSTGDGPFDNLLWQAIIGAWPASRERLHAYAEKASREAGVSTTWTAPNAEFEQRVHAIVDTAFDDDAVRDRVEAFVDGITWEGWSNSLSAKLIQLTMPGVPDVYQGSELWETSLVDPDNRRPIDLEVRRRLLHEIDAAVGDHPLPLETGAAKLLVVSRALRLRRDRPELFTRYWPLEVVGRAAAHAIAFDRGDAVTVATRLPLGLAARGEERWGDTELLLPRHPLVDVLTERRFDGGRLRLANLLDTYPVALLAPAHRSLSEERSDETKGSDREP